MIIKPIMVCQYCLQDFHIVLAQMKFCYNSLELGTHNISQFNQKRFHNILFKIRFTFMNVTL